MASQATRQQYVISIDVGFKHFAFVVLDCKQRSIHRSGYGCIGGGSKSTTDVIDSLRGLDFGLPADKSGTCLVIERQGATGNPRRRWFAPAGMARLQGIVESYFVCLGVDHVVQFTPSAKTSYVQRYQHLMAKQPRTAKSRAVAIVRDVVLPSAPRGDGAAALQRMFQRRRAAGAAPGNPKEKKDDLCDALVQALAFVCWEPRSLGGDAQPIAPVAGTAPPPRAGSGSGPEVIDLTG
jgi:hypothetical protein